MATGAGPRARSDSSKCVKTIGRSIYAANEARGSGEGAAPDEQPRVVASTQRPEEGANVLPEATGLRRA
eukprot:15463250-Alexandrium_andersonii.AAC.1